MRWLRHEDDVDVEPQTDGDANRDGIGSAPCLRVDAANKRQ